MTMTNTTTSRADLPGGGGVGGGGGSAKMIIATPTCSVASTMSPSRTSSPPAAVFTFVEDEPTTITTTRGDSSIDEEIHPFSKAINDNSSTATTDKNNNNNNDDDDDGSFLDQTVSTEIKQKIAMDKFLVAQLSGNTIAKEDAWRELVLLMKRVGGGGDARSMSSNVSAGSGGSRNNDRRRISKNIGRRRNSSNSLGIGGRIVKGGASKDDVLGTICITNSAMKNIKSTHSSLTANTTDSDNHYLDVTPEGGEGGGGNERDGEETPPNVLPILSTSGIKVEQSPMVSPLSLGGSFDDDDDDVLIRPVNIMIGEQHYHPLATTTEITTKPHSQSTTLKRRDEFDITSSNELRKKSMMSSIHKKKNPGIFFDIRKPFADNYSLRSNDDDPLIIQNNFVTPSLADSISEDNTSERHSTSVVSWSRTGLDAAAFTMNQRTETETGTDNYTTTVNSRNNCSDVDQGAVMLSTDATKYYFTALLGDKKPTKEVVLSQQQYPNTQLKLLDTKSKMVNDSSTKKETIDEVVQQQLRSTPIGLDNFLSTSSDQHRSPRRKTKHRRGGNNNNNSLPSLEDQIRNVLLRNDDEGGNEDEVVNEGSLGLLDKPKKNTISVGSTTSAQEILMELRTSTTSNVATTRSTTPPCSLVIGSLDAPPPLGIVSIGGRSQHQSQWSSSPEKLPMNNSLPALAPSRLDIPRPNRIFRKCISEPHPKTSAAATGMFSDGTVVNMSDISSTVKLSVSQ